MMGFASLWIVLAMVRGQRVAKIAQMLRVGNALDVKSDVPIPAVRRILLFPGVFSATSRLSRILASHREPSMEHDLSQQTDSLRSVVNCPENVMIPLQVQFVACSYSCRPPTSLLCSLWQVFYK